MFFLLVHKGITDTHIKKIDNICEELNAINTVIIKPRIIKRRRGTNQRAVPDGNRDHLIQKHENSNAKPLAPLPQVNKWTKPLIPKVIVTNNTNTSVGTATTSDVTETIQQAVQAAQEAATKVANEKYEL